MSISAPEVPARPRDRAAKGPRRGVFEAVTMCTVLVVALSIVVVDQATAAATPGTYTIGSTPIELNQASDPGLGSITPTPDAAEIGMFGPQASWPIIPIHAALSRNGHVISYGTPMNSSTQGGLVYDDWDVAAGFDSTAHRTDDSTHGYNSFCNALVALDNGRLLMVGGNSTMSSMTYDPITHAQDMGEDLAYQRWYATALRLTDGRILTLGGADYYNTGAYLTPDDNSKVAITPEIGSGTGAWTTLPGAASALAFGAEDNRWWYPRAFNGPSGMVVGVSGNQIWSLSTAGEGSVTSLGTLPFNPKASGSQVMYAPGKVLVAGGGQPFNEETSAATQQAAIVTFSGATATVTPTASMSHARNWLNLTVLPTGDVLANGGTRIGTVAGAANAVTQAEIWNPETGTWSTVASAQRTRTYHSTSLLLPSGAVFTAGGGAPGPEDNLNAELYYPAYLFEKDATGTVRWASRPAISTIAGSATYGGQVSLTIADGRDIASASLINLASVTHSQNTDQRRIPLTISQTGGTVTATLPSSMDTMPSGDYELFVVDRKGVPSTAQILTIRRDGPGSVTVGSPRQATDPSGELSDTSGSVRLTVGSTIGIESSNYPGYRLQHQNFKSYLKPADTTSNQADKDGTSWIVRTGLASASGVSLESVDWPGYFLAAPANNAAGAMTLAKNDGSEAFATRATFAPVTGTTGQNSALQVWGNTSLYLRHQNFQFWAQPLENSDLGRADTTFVFRAGLSDAPPSPGTIGGSSTSPNASASTGTPAPSPTSVLTVGNSIGIEATNYPGYRLQHQNFNAYLKPADPTSNQADKDGTSWIVRTGLASASGVSLESVDWPGYFLAAPANNAAGAMMLIKNDGSTAFANRATFAVVTGTTGQNTALQVWGNRSLYLRHQNFQFWAQPLENSDLGRADTTFVLKSGLSAPR